MVATKVVDGVHYIHLQDLVIIHQDLKPQNVLVGLSTNVVNVFILFSRFLPTLMGFTSVIWA